MGLGHSNKRYVLVMTVTMCIDGAAAVMPFSLPLRDKSSEIVAQHMVEVILWHAIHRKLQTWLEPV
eukprot:4939429-Amphidinium_carterae.1